MHWTPFRRVPSAAIGIATLLAVLPTGAARAVVPAQPPRIVAIGDIHGDVDAFRAILKRVGLIDDRDGWRGGNTTLVQTGDFMDRGTKVRDVMDLLMALEQRARPSGGRLVSLLGNHETMNLMGELRDVTPEIYSTFADDKSDQRREAGYAAHVKLNADRVVELKTQPAVYAPPSREAWMAAHPPGLIEYREALDPEGRYGKWLRSKDAVAQLGDTIFLHGGIQSDMAPKKLDDLNGRIRKEIATFDRARRMMIDRKLIMPFFTLQEMLEATRAELEAVAQARPSEGGAPFDAMAGARLNQLELLELDTLQKMGAWFSINPNGPLWFRGYATWTSEEGTPQLTKLLGQYKAGHVVVGHTIMASMRITPRFSSQVFLIDTGMLSSHYPGGRPSALEIRDGRYTALYLDGQMVLLEPKGPTAGGSLHH